MRYVIGNSENLLMNNYHRLTLVLAIALALGLAPPAFGAAVKQKTFVSAEEGVKALMEAVKKSDTNATLAILGPEAKSLIQSGDQVSDRAASERFVKSYEESNKLVKSGDTKAVLEVGKDAWPFPIPLVKESAGWRFDTQEGKEEIINRRIGRNELDVIQVCLAIVDAEREYYQRDPDGDKLLQYAQKLISTKGKRDGLYWETKSGEQPSPLGLLGGSGQRGGIQGRRRETGAVSRLLLQIAHGTGQRRSGRRLRLSSAGKNDGRVWCGGLSCAIRILRDHDFHRQP